MNKHGCGCSLDGEDLENVESFTYRGSKVTSDGRSKTEIISCIHQAKTDFNKKRNLFTSNSIEMNFRKHLLKIFGWNVLFHINEMWTVGEQKKSRVVAFEFRCYRRLLKIPWVDKVTIEKVLKCLLDTENRETSEYSTSSRSGYSQLKTIIGHG